MKGILGRKVGMTQVFTKDGKLIPVTVVSVEPNTVMQVKTVETDGYSAIQLGVVDKKEKNATVEPATIRNKNTRDRRTPHNTRYSPPQIRSSHSRRVGAPALRTFFNRAKRISRHPARQRSAAQCRQQTAACRLRSLRQRPSPAYDYRI